MAQFAETWRIVSSPEDSKLSPDGLSFSEKDTGKRSARSVSKLVEPKYGPTSFSEWKSSRNRLTRILILSIYGSICRNFGDSFQSRGLYANSWWT